MSTERKTIRLLIIEDSQNEAERLVSLFRNAGNATRAHRLTSIEALSEALEQSWDLLIAAPTSEFLDPVTALQVIQKKARDISFIQLVPHPDSELITEALDLGVQDAVPQGHDHRLLLVAKRELTSLDDRRSRRAAEVALREVEKRCQLLLDSSIDAIAYVHEGMHIYANRSYLKLFNYKEADDLAGVPMVDLISPDDQESFKSKLRSYSTSGEPTDFNSVVKLGKDKVLPVTISLSNAQYDGEPCIQLVLRLNKDNSKLEEKLRQVSSQDAVTGLFNRNHFIGMIEKAAERAINNGQQSTLAYISIDHPEVLLNQLGITGFDNLLTQLANTIKTLLPQAEHSRFADDAFAVLLNSTNPEQAEEQLDALVKKVGNHLFSVDGKTAQAFLSVGAAGFNETTADAKEVIDRAYRCAESVRNHKGNGLKIYNAAEDIAAAANRGDLVATIQHGLTNNQFNLLYQPIVSLRGEHNEHYEVLLDARNAENQKISNRELFNAAVSSKLAVKLDRWIVLHAMKALTERLQSGKRTRLFINITSETLQDQSFSAWFMQALQVSRIPADVIVFQISEPDAVTYLKQAKVLSAQLAQVGCELCLSRFGGAINPFNTLEHLTAHFVKLDENYVNELEAPEQQERLQAVLDQLHKQSKKTIVPFVENAGMLAPLWSAGVNYIQGNYLQEPSSKMNYDFAAGDA